ncbi:MAG: ATP-binding protein [Nocardioidaceae bacterium]
MCLTTPISCFALTDSVDSPQAARRFVREHGCDDHGTLVSDDLELAASELVANAVLHGRPPIALQLSCQTNDVRLAVTDAGVMLAEESGHAGGLGQGLRIVAQLSKAWGTTPIATGKEVWCVLATGTIPMQRRPSDDA